MLVAASTDKFRAVFSFGPVQDDPGLVKEGTAEENQRSYGDSQGAWIRF